MTQDKLSAEDVVSAIHDAENSSLYVYLRGVHLVRAYAEQERSALRAELEALKARVHTAVSALAEALSYAEVGCAAQAFRIAELERERDQFEADARLFAEDRDLAERERDEARADCASVYVLDWSELNAECQKRVLAYVAAVEGREVGTTDGTKRSIPGRS